jgi:putative IMPACT (imprinted ancient) family translation regulator
MTAWRTIARPVTGEGDRIKGARFLARAWPLDPGEAGERSKAAVAEARGGERDAVHHAFAYRVAPEPDDFRWSDDGEPIGSAGRAILQRIDQLGVVNVLVIVSRWQGGQKLAVPDLAKGYGDAARAVLGAAAIVPFVPTTRLAVTFGYALSGAVQGVLAAFAAAHEQADYGTEVCLVVRVASARRAAFEAALRDATAGRATVAPAARAPG